MTSPRRPPVFVAIDTPDVDKASCLSTQVDSSVGGVKLGLEFFNRHGHAGIRRIAERQTLFLDMKFHDIPNTVAGAIRSVADLRPFCLTIHASGGAAMMLAARKAADVAAAEIGCQPMRLLGVTVLTSFDENDLDAVGQRGPVSDQVLRLTDLSLQSGLDGIVTSAHEVSGVRERFGRDMMIVVPGIRPASSGIGDQKRVMTPAQAIAAGASHLVIGRPITAADDPGEAAKRIATELGY